MSGNLRLLLLFLCTLLAGYFLSSCSPSSQEKMPPPKASQGFLDLSNWDFEKNGTISLEGEWDFYWMQLIEPEAFKEKKRSPSSINVPGYWGGVVINNQPLNEDGFATMRLQILINTQSKILGLKVHPMNTAYKLWVDDELVSSNGTVGKSKESMIPQRHVKVVFFQPKQN